MHANCCRKLLLSVIPICIFFLTILMEMKGKAFVTQLLCTIEEWVTLKCYTSVLLIGYICFALTYSCTLGLCVSRSGHVSLTIPIPLKFDRKVHNSSLPSHCQVTISYILSACGKSPTDSFLEKEHAPGSVPPFHLARCCVHQALYEPQGSELVKETWPHNKCTVGQRQSTASVPRIGLQSDDIIIPV